MLRIRAENGKYMYRKVGDANIAIQNSTKVLSPFVGLVTSSQSVSKNSYRLTGVTANIIGSYQMSPACLLASLATHISTPKSTVNIIICFRPALQLINY